METNGSPQPTRQRMALIELTPAAAERLRDPRIVLAIVAVLTGAGALLAGYLGVSGTLDPGKQLPYLISGGVGGLFLLGVAAALLFSADMGGTRQDVRAMADQIEIMSAELQRLSGVIDDLTTPRRRSASGRS
jgi:hypothetical protein